MSKDRKDKEPLEDFIAGAIREAVERGEFDNLKGKGKRQYINSEEMVNPKMLASKLLKNADLPPPWVLQEDEIKLDIEQAEQYILRAHRSRLAALSQPRADPQIIEQNWQNALKFLQDKVEQVNKKILKFNITIPPQMPHLHKPRVRVEKILEKHSIKID
ncbi:MAG: DUF1992 domain-containing protein [Abitibacteriaceae bacterium]|nr:DUF1992 domain-containing protein [Abditibacteriaceae bacterium]